MQFWDRFEAGRQLGPALAHHRDHDVVVLAIPRGGVPVAFQVALALDAPLDVAVVRALALPGHPDVAMGAVAEEGVLVTNDDVLAEAGVSPVALAEAVGRHRLTVRRRTGRLRAGGSHHDLVGRVAIVVDDGVATGATARAACLVARARGAAEVVLATPVADPEALPLLEALADEVVVLSTPDIFWTVAGSYRSYEEVPDSVAVALLAEARRRDRGRD